METYIDLEILGENDAEDYVVVISKKEFAHLVKFDKTLVVRHWDGEKPVVLEDYGKYAIRTKEDGSTDNNLSNLPKVTSIVVSD